MNTPTGSAANLFESALAAVMGQHREKLEAERASAGDQAQFLERRWRAFEELLGRVRSEVLEPAFRAMHDRIGLLTPNVVRNVDGALIQLALPRDEAHPGEAVIKLHLTHDDPFEHLLAAYELSVVPLLMEIEPRADFRTSIDKPDIASLGHWLGDRIVSTTRAYLSMETNPHYQKHAMAIDPVLKESFPAHLAVGVVEHGGAAYRFKSEESMRMFKSDPQRYAARV